MGTITACLANIIGYLTTNDREVYGLASGLQDKLTSELFLAVGFALHSESLLMKYFHVFHLSG